MGGTGTDIVLDSDASSGFSSSEVVAACRNEAVQVVWMQLLRAGVLYVN
jgi:hypothetical protein